MEKKIVYVDMDGVLVDFKSGIDQLSEKTKLAYENRLDEVPGIFSLMKPIKNGLEVITHLQHYYDIYILSTAPWGNPSAWIDKLKWIQKYLPKIGYKRLILSHNKHLNKGDYLIDDRTANGAGKFEGQHIHFGKGEYKDWVSVYKFFLFEVKFVKMDMKFEEDLLKKITANKDRKSIDILCNYYKKFIEIRALECGNDDLASEEYKRILIKAKEGIVNSALNYKEQNSCYLSFPSYAIEGARFEILEYLRKKDGHPPLPRSRIGSDNSAAKLAAYNASKKHT